jgi:luciferase family oxidoreductase group 1
VLDLAPVATGSSAREALANSLDLARHVEEWGYRRFWVAEHHNMPGIASASPPVLIGSVAAVTSSIRVGSGGVMLPNHAPLVVAEQFGMLEALHPGRIDLGLGRAPGTDPATAASLRRRADAGGAEDFPQQVGELIGYFHADNPIIATPAVGNEPDVWLLGSSLYSAQLAAVNGMPFSFAHHFSAESTLPALRAYRANFRPSARLAQPYAMLGVAVICAEDDERAQWLAAPSLLSFLRLRSGRPGTMPTPEEAADYPYSAAERAFVERRLDDMIVGGPDAVQAGLDALLAATDADELMITTQVHGHADRLRSHELVAELRGLTTAQKGAPHAQS